MFITFRQLFLTTVFVSCLTTSMPTRPLLQNFTAGLFAQAAALFVDGTQHKMFTNLPYFCVDLVRAGSTVFGVTLPMICTGLKMLYIVGLGNDSPEVVRELAYIAAFFLTKQTILRQQS